MSLFYKNKASKDGKTSKCAVCIRNGRKIDSHVLHQRKIAGLRDLLAKLEREEGYENKNPDEINIMGNSPVKEAAPTKKATKPKSKPKPKADKPVSKEVKPKPKKKKPKEVPKQEQEALPKQEKKEESVEESTSKTVHLETSD
jgi:hypothetical protein